jgi:hypothetical protein
MNRDEREELRALLWRRPLSEEEKARLQAWVAAHPEEREDWELEQGLTLALSRLREQEVPSNLAARVWAAIEGEESHERGWRWAEGLGWLRGVWIRWAVAGAAAVLVGVTWWQGAQAPEVLRPEVVQVLSELAPPEALAEFEVVSRLFAGPTPDVELLSLLQ